MERFETICIKTGNALAVLFGVSGAAFLTTLTGYLALRIGATFYQLIVQ